MQADVDRVPAKIEQSTVFVGEREHDVVDTIHCYWQIQDVLRSLNYFETRQYAGEELVYDVSRLSILVGAGSDVTIDAQNIERRDFDGERRNV